MAKKNRYKIFNKLPKLLGNCKRRRGRKPKKKCKKGCQNRHSYKPGCRMCLKMQLAENNKPFEQFLHDLHKQRKSHQTSSEIRSYAEAIWACMSAKEKEPYVKRAKQVPYVFETSDNQLFEVITNLRTALKCSKMINFLELVRTARNISIWKRKVWKSIKEKDKESSEESTCDSE